PVHVAGKSPASTPPCDVVSLAPQRRRATGPGSRTGGEPFLRPSDRPLNRGRPAPSVSLLRSDASEISEASGPTNAALQRFRVVVTGAAIAYRPRCALPRIEVGPASGRTTMLRIERSVRGPIAVFAVSGR